MRHFHGKFLVCCLFLPACGSHTEGQKGELTVVQRVFLRDTPAENGKETVELNPQQSLKDLDETGIPESQVSLNGQYFQAPWIKVETGKGQQGWVPAWALAPSTAEPDWLIQKRVQAYFGKGLLEKRNALLASLLHPEMENVLAEDWRQALQWRDTVLQLFAANAAARPGLQMNWLGETLPGFIFQEQETRPRLYADYAYWHEKALKTNGLQDDGFFETCLAVFPVDSIESPAPVWKFALSDSEALSNLGKGNHLGILLRLDKIMPGCPLFKTELNAIKDRILADIFEEKRYWQSKEKILEELDQILAQKPGILTQEELEALQIRKRMFENPEEMLECGIRN